MPMQIFEDERLTAALLDRLPYKAHILEFSGAESYRFRECMQRKAHRASDSPHYDDGVVPFSTIKWFLFDYQGANPRSKVVLFSFDSHPPPQTTS